MNPRHGVIPGRFGVRGRAMHLCAFIWCLFGVGVLIGGNEPRPGTFHQGLPLWFGAGMWFLTGLIAAATSANRERSVIGLGALVVVPAFRAASFLWSNLLHLLHLWVPGFHPDGYNLGWYAALWYLTMIALVVIVAKIPGQVDAPLTGREAER